MDSKTNILELGSDLNYIEKEFAKYGEGAVDAYIDKLITQFGLYSDIVKTAYKVKAQAAELYSDEPSTWKKVRDIISVIVACAEDILEKEHEEEYSYSLSNDEEEAPHNSTEEPSNICIKITIKKDGDTTCAYVGEYGELRTCTIKKNVTKIIAETDAGEQIPLYIK